jgi:hypothetical protein
VFAGATRQIALGYSFSLAICLSGISIGNGHDRVGCQSGACHLGEVATPVNLLVTRTHLPSFWLLLSFQVGRVKWRSEAIVAL